MSTFWARLDPFLPVGPGWPRITDVGMETRIMDGLGGEPSADDGAALAVSAKAIGMKVHTYRSLLRCSVGRDQQGPKARAGGLGRAPGTVQILGTMPTFTYCTMSS